MSNQIGNPEVIGILPRALWIPTCAGMIVRLLKSDADIQEKLSFKTLSCYF